MMEQDTQEATGQDVEAQEQADGAVVAPTEATPSPDIDPELAALKGKERADKIREMFNEQGMKRGEIAKKFGVVYQVVYQFTKPPEGERQGRGRVTLESGQPRADYIREQVAAGRSRSEVAKELGVSYQIVYAATKTAKAGEGGDGAAATATATQDGSASTSQDTQEVELQEEDENLFEGEQQQ